MNHHSYFFCMTGVVQDRIFKEMLCSSTFSSSARKDVVNDSEHDKWEVSRECHIMSANLLNIIKRSFVIPKWFLFCPLIGHLDLTQASDWLMPADLCWLRPTSWHTAVVDVSSKAAQSQATLRRVNISPLISDLSETQIFTPTWRPAWEETLLRTVSVTLENYPSCQDPLCTNYWAEIENWTR